jgi:eukaryotic-like serine/threonine-protein kinase
MTTTIEAGVVLAGKYRVERVLGQGGMGVVVAAHHLHLDSEVAIKFLLPEALFNLEAVARFGREARAAVKIKSEHIARVTDVGTLESGAPYMVMEYLRGSDLAAVLRDRRTLALEDAADYLLQACEAIAEAHVLGIVHRDLKPANLFLVRRPDGSPCVKVLDFGISKVTTLTGSADDHAMTKTAAIMGSPLYMSPEQLASARDVDARTDIWALGVILFELLTGDAPFFADTLPQLCAAILAREPRAVRDFRPELPIGIDDLILACLQKERGARVQTVTEFANRLAPFAPKRSRLSVERIANLSRTGGVESARVEDSPDSELPLPPATFASFGRTTRPSARVKGRVLGLLAIGLVAGAILLLRHRAPESVPRPSAASGASALEGAVAVSALSAVPIPSTTPPQVQPPPGSAHSALPAPTTASSGGKRAPKKSTPAAQPTPMATALKDSAPVPAVPAPAARAEPNCDIPYSFDARGNKVFKKGCL